MVALTIADRAWWGRTCAGLDRGGARNGCCVVGNGFAALRGGTTVRGGEERGANRDGFLLAVGTFDVYAKGRISAFAPPPRAKTRNLRGFSKKMRNPN